MTENRLAAASPIELAADTREESSEAAVSGDRGRSLMVALIACALLAAIGWRFSGAPRACSPSGLHELDGAGRLAVASVARRIVTAESSGDAAARNPLSSATGAGQFLDATWLDTIKA